jgi:hypothetical protein
MAADVPAVPLPDEPPRGLSRGDISLYLGRRRDELVAQIPRRIAAARHLTPDEHELVVDESIDYVITEQPKPLPGLEDVERMFWRAANHRVRRTCEGRYSMVRGGFQQVEFNDDHVPAAEDTPEAAAIHTYERETLLEFTACLTPSEQTVLKLKYPAGGRELGRFEIARILNRKPFEVRRAERAIVRKLKEFSALVTAGTLCEARRSAFVALAFGQASGAELAVAQAHLQSCGPCRTEYKRLLRDVRAGRLQREIGQLLPVPSIETVDRRRAAWDVITDWTSRPFGHEATINLSPLTSAGRGMSGLAGAKLLAMCIGGALAVGGGLYCVESLPQHSSRHPHQSRPRRATRTRTPPQVASVASPTSTPTSTPTPRSTPKPTRRGSRGEVHGDPTTHERAATISPPATTTDGRTVGEFDPGPDASGPSRPAAAPIDAGPEFP